MSEPPGPEQGARAADPATPGRGRRFWRTGPGQATIVLAAVLVAAGSGSLFGRFLTFDIPEVRNLQDWKPPIVTTLYSADGRILYQFGAEKRIVVGLDQIAEPFIDALVATEDSNFYRHVGIDPSGIARAVVMDIIHLSKAQGGSTITQQLARSLFLKPEKTIRRKLQEMVLALQIEKSFTKNEILTFYCNQVYMGHGRYGVEAASQYYFGKPAKDMDLVESALLAGMIQRPEAYSPIRHPDRALARRNHVLNRMAKVGKIDAATAAEAAASPVEVAKFREEDNLAPYFVEEVRRYLDAKYGDVALYEEGLEVHTTLDPAMQAGANKAIFEGLRRLDKRQGFRPIEENVLAEHPDLESFTHPSWRKPPVVGTLRFGVVTAVDRRSASVRLGEYAAELDPKAIAWTRVRRLDRVFEVGDLAPFLVLSIDEEAKRLGVALDQIPLVEGALIAIDPATGEIRALVGGYDFSRSEFDRAVQSRRQAGSAFKPFVFTAALDSGYTLADRVFDEPTVFVDPATEDEYQPNNYYRKYYGLTTLRVALEKSRNISAVKLLNQVGFRKTIEVARKMGITSPLRPYPSMALGTMEVSLIDLATAYSIFPNQGVRVQPHFIRYVTDREGRIREEAQPKVTEAIQADVAYVMTYLLQGVTESGTGAAARALKRPVAGKTGTTDDLADAWFIGFSPSLVAGVWVGFDQKRSLGEAETGARAALPIWIDFMKAALDGQPVEKFPRPANVVYVPIDRETGLRATVDSRCPSTFLEAFVEGTEPVAGCSEVEHFRASLPYFLQRFDVTRDLELRVDDSDTLVRLVTEGLGEVELIAGGDAILLHDGNGAERRIRLKMPRSERRAAWETLQRDGNGRPPFAFGVPGLGSPWDPGGIDPDDEETVYYGVDGRRAIVIPIRYD
ncbi:MAG: penicillin-binding protein 1A [Acidobacteriota bacterium]